MFFSKFIVAHSDRIPDELIEMETLPSRRHERSIEGLFRAGLTVRGFRTQYILRDDLPKVRVARKSPWTASARRRIARKSAQSGPTRLNKICLADEVGLVNIVRPQAQEDARV